MAIVVMSVLTNLIEFKKLFRTIFTPFSYKIIAVSEKFYHKVWSMVFFLCVNYSNVIVILDGKPQNIRGPLYGKYNEIG